MPIWRVGTSCAGGGGGGAGAAFGSGRGVACTERGLGLGVFSGRVLCFFGGVVPLPTVLKFSLRYLRKIARLGSSAAAVRRSRRPASTWPCLIRHKPRPSHASPSAEWRAIAVSKESLAPLRLFSALRTNPRNACAAGLRGASLRPVSSAIFASGTRPRLNCDSATRVHAKPEFASRLAARSAACRAPARSDFDCR